MLRWRLPHVVALGIALGGSELFTLYTLTGDDERGPILKWVLVLILHRPLFLFVSVAAVTAVQIWVRRRQLRLLATATAVIAFGLVNSALQASEAWVSVMPSKGFASFLYYFWLNTVFAGLLATLYEWQMRADQVLEAVRSSSIADEVIERQTLESRLSGMKARVDPEFLLAVIAHTETLYAEDIGSAERLLEQLIEFLRATLPHSSSATNTLDQEVRLCGAYLAIERSLRQEALSFQAISAAGAKGSYFPPSVLLPLVQSLLLPRGKMPRPVHLSIIAERERSCARVELTNHAAAAPPTREVLEGATAALAAIFGENVRVFTKPAPFTGMTIAIEVPHVAA